MTRSTGKWTERRSNKTSTMRLDRYQKVPGIAGRGAGAVGLWWLLGSLLENRILPGSGWRRGLLRLFGARIGRGVVIKPGVKVKWPWKLAIGDWSWIGERVWIDNLEMVTIGHHSCISQGVYICTGNHDWSDDAFALRVAPVRIGDQCWIGAQARLAPGCEVGEGCVVALGSVGSGRLEPWSVYAGAPATKRAERKERAAIHADGLH